MHRSRSQPARMNRGANGAGALGGLQTRFLKRFRLRIGLRKEREHASYQALHVGRIRNGCQAGGSASHRMRQGHSMSTLYCALTSDRSGVRHYRLIVRKVELRSLQEKSRS
jgi:hypothetical protein